MNSDRPRPYIRVQSVDRMRPVPTVRLIPVEPSGRRLAVFTFAGDGPFGRGVFLARNDAAASAPAPAEP